MKKLTVLILALSVFIFHVTPLFSAEQDPDLAKEVEIGRRAMKQIEEKWPLTSDPAVVSKLEMIIRRLEPFMSRRINWEVRLVKTEAMNAFCLPGGFIFFTTGIIDALNNILSVKVLNVNLSCVADKSEDSGVDSVPCVYLYVVIVLELFRKRELLLRLAIRP